MESVWYYARDGAQLGPVSFDDLKAAAAGGQLRPDDLVWKEGTADWVPARTVAGLIAVAAAPPAPPSYPVAPPVAPPVRPRAAEPRLPIHDSPLAAKGPPPTAKDIGELAKLFLQRTVNPNPATIAPTADEEQSLVQSGYDPVVQKYAVWRRAVLWVAVVPTALAAFFRLLQVIVMEKDDLSGLVHALLRRGPVPGCSFRHRGARRALLRPAGQVDPVGIPRWCGIHCRAGPRRFHPTDLMIDLRGGTRVGSFRVALLLNVF